MTSLESTPPKGQHHWFAIALGTVFTLLYAPLLWHWVDGWLNKSISIEHEYFSHGLLGLPYAVYLIWQNREKWQQLPDRAAPIGWALLGLGIVFYARGTTELINLSLPLLVVGIILLLKGFAGLRLQGFAVFFITLATPNSIPYLLTPFTLPLQAFIANMAGFLLFVLGVPDLAIDGIYIMVRDRVVEVAPYCAGLKMLFTSTYLAVMLLHWTGTWRSRPKVTATLIGTVIISVTVNILRNTLLTYFYGMGHNDLFHWTHESLGGDLISMLMLVGVVLWLDLVERMGSYYETGNFVGIINYRGLLGGQPRQDS